MGTNATKGIREGDMRLRGLGRLKGTNVTKGIREAKGY